MNIDELVENLLCGNERRPEEDEKENGVKKKMKGEGLEKKGWIREYEEDNPLGRAECQVRECLPSEDENSSRFNRRRKKEKDLRTKKNRRERVE